LLKLFQSIEVVILNFISISEAGPGGMEVGGVKIGDKVYPGVGKAREGD
jgi:hypothetical protein